MNRRPAPRKPRRPAPLAGAGTYAAPPPEQAPEQAPAPKPEPKPEPKSAPVEEIELDDEDAPRKRPPSRKGKTDDRDS